MGMIGVNALAAKIVSRYDRNKDGKVALNGPKAEDLRRTSEYTHDKLILSTFSQDRLFKAADKAGNNDGFVTAQEVAAVVGRFDANHNNGLETRRWLWDPRQEYDNFADAFGEELVDVTYIPLPNPQPPYVPVPHPPHQLGNDVQLA
jgi:hypothetical protein